METQKKLGEATLNGFSPISSPPVLWKSRKRSAGFRNVDKAIEKQEEFPNEEKQQEDLSMEPEKQDETPSAIAAVLSEKRKALFEPLEPITNVNGKRPSAESLLPPPDFDSASYPRGWLIGKKRKLVNVDVVESCGGLPYKK